MSVFLLKKLYLPIYMSILLTEVPFTSYLIKFQTISHLYSIIYMFILIPWLLFRNDFICIHQWRNEQIYVIYFCWGGCECSPSNGRDFKNFQLEKKICKLEHTWEKCVYMYPHVICFCTGVHSKFQGFKINPNRLG